jgi:hypothetical protein
MHIDMHSYNCPAWCHALHYTDRVALRNPARAVEPCMHRYIFPLKIHWQVLATAPESYGRTLPDPGPSRQEP